MLTFALLNALRARRVVGIIVSKYNLFSLSKMGQKGISTLRFSCLLSSIPFQLSELIQLLLLFVLLPSTSLAVSQKAFLIPIHLLSTLLSSTATLSCPFPSSPSSSSSSSSIDKQLNLFLSSNWNFFLVSGMFSLLVSYLLTTCTFLLVLLSFSSVFAITRLWSLATSAPLYALTSCTDRLKLDRMTTGSIWLRYWPFGEVHVYLCMSLCGNIVDTIAGCSVRKKLRTALHCHFFLLVSHTLPQCLPL